MHCAELLFHLFVPIEFCSDSLLPSLSVLLDLDHIFQFVNASLQYQFLLLGVLDLQADLLPFGFHLSFVHVPHFSHLRLDLRVFLFQPNYLQLKLDLLILQLLIFAHHLFLVSCR